MKEKTILIVDDEWSMLELLKRVLEISGYKPILAQTGPEFKKMAFEGKPDMLILDIVLEGADGPTLYEEVLREGFDRDIPVLFLSGLAKDVTPTKPKLGRQFSLLGKPLDVDVLVTEIDDLLN